MVGIKVLDDGTEVLVSDERFKVLSFTEEGESDPSMFGVVITEEMRDAITQGWIR